MGNKNTNSICEICGSSFYVKPWLKNKGWGKYCSIACRNKSQKKGKFVNCNYCGKKIYRSRYKLQKPSKTGKYFCSKSCHCAWKNKHRVKKPRMKQGTSSPKTVRKEKVFIEIKRPCRKILYNLYWQEDKSQTEISNIFSVSHTTVKRWFKYHDIKIKPRTLSCGRDKNSLKNLELGRSEESQRKSAQSRTIYSKNKIIQEIKRFFQENNRVPLKREFSSNPIYPDYRTVRDFFGTWNDAIKAAGYSANDPPFFSNPLKGKLISKDGHECRSVSEIIVDDWLYKNNIPHQREVLYPEGQYRCDFVVNNIFIEFFGLAGIRDFGREYDKIIKIKRKLCRKYNIPLIELYQKDLYKLDEVFKEKMEAVLKTSGNLFPATR